MAKNKDGSIGVVYELPDKNDTLNFVMKIYYPNGRLQRMATVVNGKYSGKIITFWANGKVYQVDSLYQPCDMNVQDCNEILYRYNENGSISQQFTVAGGSLNGLSRHYDGNGVLVKEYYLINDSIKEGDYKEYFENGRILRQATYHMDTLVGTEYIFKENGDTAKYYSHYRGNPDLPYKKWLDNGNILLGNYSPKTSKYVVWKWYDKSGKELRTKIVHPSKNGFVTPE